jgi:hypothetical protein
MQSPTQPHVMQSPQQTSEPAFTSSYGEGRGLSERRITRPHVKSFGVSIDSLSPDDCPLLASGYYSRSRQASQYLNPIPSGTENSSYCTVWVPKMTYEEVVLPYAARATPKTNKMRIETHTSESAFKTLYSSSKQCQMESYIKFVQQGAELQALQIGFQKLQLSLHLAQRTNMSLSAELLQTQKDLQQAHTASQVSQTQAGAQHLQHTDGTQAAAIQQLYDQSRSADSVSVKATVLVLMPSQLPGGGSSMPQKRGPGMALEGGFGRGTPKASICFHIFTGTAVLALLAAKASAASLPCFSGTNVLALLALLVQTCLHYLLYWCKITCFTCCTRMLGRLRKWHAAHSSARSRKKNSFRKKKS